MRGESGPTHLRQAQDWAIFVPEPSPRAWLVVVNWERFQHYSDRDPPWVKNYVALLHKDEYVQLSAHRRAILHGVWMAYASAHGVLRGDTRTLTRRLALKVTTRDLDALNEAGFVEFSASKPLALARAGARARTRSQETEEEKENPPTPLAEQGGKVKLTARQLRAFTGCRQTRGTHGVGHVRDVLGVDRPPKDWPHEPPSRADVEQALAQNGATPVDELMRRARAAARSL